MIMSVWEGKKIVLFYSNSTDFFAYFYFFQGNLAKKTYPQQGNEKVNGQSDLNKWSGLVHGAKIS